jgi:2-polyprenyl-3-methyl-5-hydroxy-6-metoxy-1,4-benzoquinol methylase
MTDTTTKKRKPAAKAAVIEEAAVVEEPVKVFHSELYVNPSAQAYDEAYFKVYAGTGYSYAEPWLSFFGAIATELIRLYKPKTAMDVGAAFGILVNALRNRGVNAKGIDVSEYAAGQSQSKNVFVQDLAHDWALQDYQSDERYNLVTCIEVLEHIEPSRAAIAIRNLCSIVAEGGTIVFTSASSKQIDSDDVFHVNVQDEAYWLALFAEQGFVKTKDNVQFICPWAIALRKA